MARGRNRRRAERAAADEDAAPAGERHGVISVALLALVLAATWAAGVAGYRWLTDGEALRIRAVRYEGLSRATEAELAELSPVRPGDNVLVADLEAMERALSSHPWVKKAVARRQFWPPEVTVRVREREAVALVELGALYLVDRDAQVFKRAAPGDGLDLPLVTGFTREDYIQRRGDLEPLIAGALALLDGYTRERLDDFARVSEVHVDLDQGVTLYVGEGTQVRLGTGELQQKLERLSRIVSALGVGARQVEVLHLDNRTHPSWITVRMAGRNGEVSGRQPVAVVAAMRAKGQPDEAAPERAEGSGGRSFTASPRVEGGLRGP